jgi:hypothetical protein
LKASAAVEVPGTPVGVPGQTLTIISKQHSISEQQPAPIAAHKVS